MFSDAVLCCFGGYCLVPVLDPGGFKGYFYSVVELIMLLGSLLRYFEDGGRNNVEDIF